MPAQLCETSLGVEAGGVTVAADALRAEFDDDSVTVSESLNLLLEMSCVEWAFAVFLDLSNGSI
ncbi:hypothetical protein AB0876_25030 [Mycobacterium sp. NPDC049093]